MELFKTLFATLQKSFAANALTVYHNGCLAFGEAESDKLLPEYQTFDTPKYIVSENDEPLLNTANVKSRFVFNTKTENNQLLFIISSKKPRAWENDYKQLLHALVACRDVFK